MVESQDVKIWQWSNPEEKLQTALDRFRQCAVGVEWDKELARFEGSVLPLPSQAALGTFCALQNMSWGLQNFTLYLQTALL